MKKRVKDISSGSKPELPDNSRDIYSSSRKPHPGGRKPKKPWTAKRVLLTIGKVFTCFVLIGVITMSVVITGLTVYVMKATETDSNISLEKEDIMDTGITVVYGTDANGQMQPLAKMSNGVRREWVDISDIPKVVKDAIVAIEDKNFYRHEGVDFGRTFLAFLNMFLHFWDTKQGASTITQQLIKNLTDDRETDGLEAVRRKTREIYRAMSLERTYSKDQILQAYLNVIPVGGMNGNYAGIQTAARLYYNKDISEVTLAEAASLAAITNAPVKYEPIGHPEDNKARRDLTLNYMLEQGMITQQEHDQAVNTPVEVHPGQVVGNTTGKEYQSYFVDAALNQVVEEYAKKNGISSEEANEEIKSGGYSIYTTIDIDLQNKLEAAFENPSTFGWGSFADKPNVAFVVYDLNGNMKACVGNTGVKEAGDRSSTNFATQGVRSPGSTMKPLAAYAPAIENNLINYSSIVDDNAIRNVEGKPWPQNFDHRYNGNVPVYYALEKSLNTIPTKLVEQMGVQQVCDFLSQKLGISTLVPPDAPHDGVFESSGTAMGALTNGVKLSELTNAYQVFGNGGTFVKSHTYSSVQDGGGNSILEPDTSVTQAISPDTSDVMNRLLRNVITEGTGTAANLDSMGIEVVGKTGTSNDDKNLTFVGLTHDYVAGVWIGYGSDDRTLPKSTTSPAKIWRTVMSSLLEGRAQEDFAISTANQMTFCMDSGGIATANCPNQHVGYYRSSDVPPSCKVHGG